MSCTFSVGNSTFVYNEPHDYQEATLNLKLSISGLEIALNYMKDRLDKIKTAQEQGFASFEDFCEYERCQRVMRIIEERKVKTDSSSGSDS